MSGAHFTLDELRECALSRNELAIAPVLRHCFDCRDCADRLAVIITLLESASEVPPNWGLLAMLRRVAAAGFGEVRSEEQAARRRPRGVVIAGALLVVMALAITATWWAMTPNLSGDSRLVGLATTEPIPARVVQFHLGGLLPVQQILGALPVQPRLLAAGEKLAAGDYATATRELEQLRQDAPSSRLVAAYLGIANYLNGDNTARTGRLLEEGMATARTDDAVAATSTWYLGNLLLRTGRTREAVEVFQQLSDLPNRAGRQALETLQRIEAMQ